MSAKISACWISSGILLGFVLFVRSEHFYLPKENNVFSGDPKDDWIPVSGIDKRSTRFGAADRGLTRVVHITPPVRYPPSDRPPQTMDTDESNKVEVFAQPPPAILGSFSDFGHATVEAREPANALNFRPSAFDRLYDEVDDRRFRQQTDYRGEPVQDEQKPPPPPAIVVFNAQQRHPQNYHKTSAPAHAQYYQNVQYREANNKNAGYNKEQDPRRRLAPYLVPNEHVYPRPAASQGNNKQTYAEPRPKPYLVNPSEPIHHHHHHHHHQQQQQHQKQQQQSYKLQPSSTEGGEYFQRYHPGRVVESQNPYPPQVSTFARPFELQTGGGDRNVFIRPDQYVQDLNVGTEVRFAAQEPHGLQQQDRPSSSRLQPAVPLDASVSTAAAGFAHPATRPFSKYQTPTPTNEELYRIFPVKEVNALPATFLPTPITLLHDIVQSSEYERPKTTTTSRPTRFKEPSWDGTSEYEAQEQDENESGEQSYDVLRSPTRPVPTTTTSTTTTAVPPPRVTRKRKPTTTTTTTTTVAPDEYDEYAVPNRQQLQLQEQFQPEEYRETTASTTASSTTSSTTASAMAGSTTSRESTAADEERPLPVSVNKYKKKKPLPATRPKEPQPSAEVQLDVTPSPSTVTTTAPPHPLSQPSPDTTAATDTRAKTKAKYGNGTRPRFSIKDYKTSTTSTTTSTEKAPSGRRTTTTTSTAVPETVVEQQTARKRYRPRPNRYKTTTSTTATATATAATAATAATEEQQRQETATAAAYRSKYKPGGKYHNRLRTSTESADEGVESATEPTRPMAVYSAKRRTVPTASTADEHNAVRRSSTTSPLDDDVTPPEPLDAASSEDVDYVATTVAVTLAVAPARHKYHTSYAAERPLLPIESFFQSSMAASKRYHNHNKRR